MRNENGFTLVEMLVYIALVTIIIVPTISIAWILVGDQVKHERLTEINDVGTFAMEKISRETKLSDAIGAGTTYGNTHDTLELVQGAATIAIEPVERTISVGATSVTIHTLQITQGGVSTYLTSDLSDVTQFQLTDVSSGGVESLEVNVIIEAVNPTNTVIYDAANEWNTTITIR